MLDLMSAAEMSSLMVKGREWWVGDRSQDQQDTDTKDVVGWDSREVDGDVLALLAEALSNPIMWLNYLFA